MPKTCRDCRRALPPDAFYKDRSHSDGLASYCKECHRARNRASARRWAEANPDKERSRNAEWRRNNPDKYREQRTRYNALKGTEVRRRQYLRQQYGLTLEQYDALALAQLGRCAICSDAAPLEVDHDHRCCAGERSCGSCVRRLLCSPCNRGLACFRDDPARLASALEYVR